MGWYWPICSGSIGLETGHSRCVGLKSMPVVLVSGQTSNATDVFSGNWKVTIAFTVGTSGWVPVSKLVKKIAVLKFILQNAPFEAAFCSFCPCSTCRYTVKFSVSRGTNPLPHGRFLWQLRPHCFLKWFWKKGCHKRQGIEWLYLKQVVDIQPLNRWH